MGDCTHARKKFAAAIQAWLLAELAEDTLAPQLTDYGLCKSCSLDFFSRFSELVSIYVHDVDAIVHVTQEQMADLPAGAPPLQSFKH